MSFEGDARLKETQIGFKRTEEFLLTLKCTYNNKTKLLIWRSQIEPFKQLQNQQGSIHCV
jgi:hypothetical protein